MRFPNFNAVLMDRATQIIQVFQVLFIPIIMGVMGASLVEKNKSHNSPKFMFALTWLTIPMLIYTCMTPRFDRTKPLANPYAILAFNAIYCFLWFVAFIAVAAYNNSAQSKGYEAIKNNKDIPDDKKPSGPSCDTTTGTPKECSLNNVGVGLGVFMWLFMLATTLIATYIALYYRIHLCTPLDAQGPSGSGDGGRQHGNIGGEGVEAHTKAAFDEHYENEEGHHEHSGLAGDGYALINEQDERDPRWKAQQRTPSLGSVYSTASGGPYASNTSAGYVETQYDAEYERDLARAGGDGSRSRSVGSGGYDAGRVGFPEGDYAYTEAGR